MMERKGWPDDGRSGRCSPSGMGFRLELFVEDMDATIGFYESVLGFELLRAEPENYASVCCGGVLFGIGPVSKLPEEGGYFTRGISSLRRGLGVEIVLKVEDLDTMYRRVVASWISGFRTTAGETLGTQLAFLVT